VVELRRASVRFRGSFPALAVLFVSGCVSVETHADYPKDLHHPDYVRRSKAVAEFAEKGDRSQLPDAFRLLLDDEGSIRLVAYLTIRDLSPGAEDFGYRPYLPPDVRFGIVTRWQAWWVRSNAQGGASEAVAGAEPGAQEDAAATETMADATAPEARGG
jgi:hypothetical protein